MFAIVAYDRKHGIAKSGRIPWSLPLDVAWFRQMTEGTAMIMGGTTYRQFKEPLPNRQTIVLSRSLEDRRVKVARTVEEAIRLAEQTGFPISVIGGASIFELFWPHLGTIFATEVDGDYNCDTFFPKIDPRQWHRSLILDWPADEHHDVSFQISRYDR